MLPGCRHFIVLQYLTCGVLELFLSILQAGYLKLIEGKRHRGQEDVSILLNERIAFLEGRCLCLENTVWSIV